MPELQSLMLCSGKFYPTNCILVTLPMTVVVHCLRNCVIITGFIIVGISTKRVNWCEEDSLPSFVAFPSTRSQSDFRDRLNAETTTHVKIILFPIVRNPNVRPSTQGQLTFHQSVLELLESKPRNFWNPRFQQYRPHRVPMKRCVRLFFILVVSNDAPFL